jgi:hypothetical protein
MKRRCPVPVLGTVNAQEGLHEIPTKFVKFTGEIGEYCTGGVNAPSVDLNAIASKTAPVPVTFTVGAAIVPGGAFKYIPSACGRVTYGELHDFQSAGLFACML